MTREWPVLKFGDFLRPNLRPYELSSNEDANLVGMRWYGQGPFHRELKPAIQIAKKSHYVIHSGDIIYNKLFAWKGSFGVVPRALDKMFVSDKFPTYALDRKRVSDRYLYWYFRCPIVWEQARLLSTGSAALSKLTLNPPKFLLLTMPTPPLEEQQRIVARIEGLAADIDHARTLRHQATEEAEALCRSLLWHDTQARPTAMAELVRLRPQDVSVQQDIDYQFAGVYSFGRGVFKGIIKKGIEFSYRTLTRLHKDDFVYPKLMAWEGALGVVSADCEGCVVSPEFPVFEVLQDKVLPEVIDTYFRTSAVWPEISGSSTGTNVRRRRLNPSDFLRYRMPLPTRGTQYLLREVRAEVNSLHALQAETAAEINAFLPAILDRAFKGEL